MNTIPAYITSLAVKHKNDTVQLNVQHLNDVFFGAQIEQQKRGSMQSALPLLLQSCTPTPYDEMPDDIFFTF